MELLGILRYVIVHYAGLAVFMLVCLVLGRGVLLISMPGDEKGDFFLRASLGMGALVVLLFLSAMFGLLNRAWVGGLTVLLVGLVIYRDGAGSTFRAAMGYINETVSHINGNLRWYVPLGILLLPIVLLPLYPPVVWDEVSYHLPYAKYYLDQGGLAVNQYLRYALHAHNMNLLYSLALMFQNDILAHLIHASAALLTAVGIYRLCTLVSDRLVGAVAAAMFLSDRSVLFLMKSAYVDLGLTLFVFLTLYIIALWQKSGEEGWLYLAGLSAGLAAGTKYLGITYIVLFGLWVLIDSRRFKPFLKFMAAAFAFGSAWYVRSWIISGDPVFPAGASVFGYSWLWSKGDADYQSWEMLQMTGIGKGPMSLLMLPWKLVTDHEAFRDSFSPLLLPTFLSPLLIFRANRFRRGLLIFTFANLFAWFYSTQILRYLLPVFPMMAVLSAAVLVGAARAVVGFVGRSMRLQRFFSYGERAVHTILGRPVWTVLNIVLAGLAVYVFMDFNGWRSPPFVGKAREAYISEKIEGYNLIKIANMDPSLGIYQMGNENAVYYAKGRIVGDWFGPARYAPIQGSLFDYPALYEKLRAFDVGLFLLNFRFIGDRPVVPGYEKYFILIAREDKQGLFGLRGVPGVEELARRVSPDQSFSAP